MPVYKFSHHLLAVLVHLAHTAVKWNTNLLTLDVGDKLVNTDDTALMKYEKKFMQKAVKGFQAASFIRLAHRHLPCRLRFLFGRYHKDRWRQLPHILHTGHTQCVNVQPHTWHAWMEACWDRLAGNGSGLGHVNTVHGQSPMGKGVLCPKLNVFGFLSCRYAYAHDKNLKNIRKNNGICFLSIFR